MTSGPISTEASVPGPTRSARTRGASRSTSGIRATSPTATATEMAMHRSPAEP